MAVTASSESTDGPVLGLINKRLRALRKKYNRIVQMEESVSQGKPINKEQEEVLRSKPSVVASIDELEKLRQPLSAAVSEEISLALQRHQQQSSISDSSSAAEEKNNGVCDDHNGGNRGGGGGGDAVVEDLLNLLYFGSLFDVKPQNDFTATMLTRTHERGCCLTYDYVTDDATDLLDETDLDLISMLGGLLISRPVDSSLSHNNALQRCIGHAKLWLANSDQPIDSSARVSYAGLREKLKKIMASDYFTITPEIKAHVEMAAAANYLPLQVPVHGVPFQVESSIAGHQLEDEEAENFQGQEIGDNQSRPAEEPHKNNDLESGSRAEVVSGQEQAKAPAEVEHVQREGEHKEQQYASRRNYQNQRGGRGNGGRRGYSNGRGGRGGPRGVVGFQNGCNLYYDQPGNNYPRNYYNNRGRSGRGGGGRAYNNNHAPGDVGVAS